MSNSSKKLTRSGSLLLSESNRPRKCEKRKSRLSNVRRKSSDSVDSFKELKNKSKLNNIFDKITLLKSQLKFLVADPETGETKSQEISNSSLNESNSSDKSTSKLELERNKLIGNNLEDTQIFSYERNSLDNSLNDTKSTLVASKFSNWLSATVDLTDEEGTERKSHQSENNSFDLKTSIVPSKLNTFNSKQQNKVESLLYKTFLMQNLGKYLSSSDESESEVIEMPFETKVKPVKKLTPRFSFRKRKSSKTFKRKGKKRRRILEYDSTSDCIEIINLDNYNSSVEDAPEKNVEEIDLENLDWSEPFYLDEVNGYEPSIEEVQQHADGRNEESESCNEIFESPNVIQSATCSNKTGDNDNKSILVSSTNLKNENSNDVSKEILNKSDVKRRLWECPICFEESKGQVIVTTLCGHIFCKNCIENYHSSQGKRCPACCTDISDKPLITLFNF